MGFPPPPNLPPVPDVPQQVSDPGFPTVPSGPAGLASICKFKIPFLHFSFGFIKLPFSFPPAIPGLPRIAFGISCDLSNPLNVTAGFPAIPGLPAVPATADGGGRKPNAPPDPDNVPGA